MLALCVGMYRACSTWQYGVVGAILEKRSGHRLGFVEGIRFAEKIDPRSGPTAWSVLKSHDFHDRFATLLRQGEAVGIYAHRDLRDVVASYSHKTGTPFATLMERGFVELCVRNDESWRSEPGVLVQRYDDLIANPVAGVEQIARHLDVALAEGEAQGIADALSWEASRRKVDQLAADLRRAGATLTAEDQGHFDPVSLLHWNHIRPTTLGRSGPAGTAEQRAQVESLAAGWLIRHGYLVDGVAPTGARPAPIARTSYATSGVDLRLDRIFRGTKGTIVDFDALHPRVDNASYYFYERGWRTINIGTTALPRDGFVAERPNDLNLACRFEAGGEPGVGTSAQAGHAAGVLADLIADGRLDDPDVIVFHSVSNVALLLAAIELSSWRPLAVVAPHDAPGRGEANWPLTLAAMGYRAVPNLVEPAVFVRNDRPDAAAVLARPMGRLDRDRIADWSVADRAAWAELAARAARLGAADPAPDEAGVLGQGDQLRGELQHVRGELQGERDMFQRERDAWQRERDACQRERDSWQRERDAWFGAGAIAQAEIDCGVGEGDSIAVVVIRFARLQAELAAARARATAAEAERDEHRDEARASRRRSRRVGHRAEALQVQVAHLQGQLNNQVETRVRQLTEADRRLVGTEQALAAARQALAEAQQPAAPPASRGWLRPSLRRLGRLTGVSRFRIDSSHR